MAFRLTALDSAGLIERVHQIATDLGIEARRWQSHRADQGFVVEFDANVTVPQERALLSKLGAVDAHCEARPLH
jgi:hypothetical protein